MRLSSAVWLLGEKANTLLGEQECSTDSHCSEVFVVGCIRTEFRGKIRCLSGCWDPGVVPMEAVGSLGGTAGGPGTSDLPAVPACSSCHGASDAAGSRRSSKHARAAGIYSGVSR